LELGLTGDTQSSYPHLLLSHNNRSLYKILDTRGLSQINLTYNNITFQVYPDSGFTNEQRSETQTRPSKNELDRYNNFRDHKRQFLTRVTRSV
jgi:hypothetical protein